MRRNSPRPKFTEFLNTEVEGEQQRRNILLDGLQKGSARMELLKALNEILIRMADTKDIDEPDSSLNEGSKC